MAILRELLNTEFLGALEVGFAAGASLAVVVSGIRVGVKVAMRIIRK